MIHDINLDRLELLAATANQQVADGWRGATAKLSAALELCAEVPMLIDKIRSQQATIDQLLAKVYDLTTTTANKTPMPLSQDPWREQEWAKQTRCKRCGKTVAENRQKYCGDGSDKDYGHIWEKDIA